MTITERPHTAEANLRAASRYALPRPASASAMLHLQKSSKRHQLHQLLQSPRRIAEQPTSVASAPFLRSALMSARAAARIQSVGRHQILTAPHKVKLHQQSPAMLPSRNSQNKHHLTSPQPKVSSMGVRGSDVSVQASTDETPIESRSLPQEMRTSNNGSEPMQNGRLRAVIRKQLHRAQALAALDIYRSKDGMGKETIQHSSGQRDSPEPVHRDTHRTQLIRREARALHDSVDYIELEFDARTHGLSEFERKAACAFDKRHTKYTAATKWHLATLKYEPTSEAAGKGFTSGLHLVAGNRYVLKDTSVSSVVSRARVTFKNKHRYRPPWKLEESIWADRSGKGYFETSESLRLLLNTDWRMAQVHHNLAYYILQVYHQPRDWKNLARDGAVDSHLVCEVRNALFRHARCIYGAFEHYSMLGTDAGARNNKNEAVDIFHIKFNSYLAFARDCKLESPECPRGQIQEIWKLVDATDDNTQAMGDSHNKSRGLNRHEWLQALVRIAARKFCRTMDNEAGFPCGDLAQAVDRLCYENMLSNLPQVALQDSNVFRKHSCYTEFTSLVVEQHEQLLQELYVTYASRDLRVRHDKSKLTSRHMMSVHEWLDLIDHLGLTRLKLLTVSLATRVFMWSRLRICQKYSDSEEARVRHLAFPDFIEAIIRIATLVALPTQNEIDQAEATDAAAFMLALRQHAPQEYDEFVRRRSRPWNSKPHQPVHICVTHLLSVIMHMVSAPAKSTVTRQSVGATDIKAYYSIEQFANAQDQEGDTADILRERLFLARQSSLNGHRLIAAVRSANAQVMESLSNVPSFSKMDPHNLTRLREAMSIAKFEHDTYVIEQGDIGDTFYIITTGNAKVCFVDPKDPDEEEVEIASLGEGDCFGERALLKDEPRNASIMADGQLFALYITRDDFEREFGKLESYNLPNKAPTLQPPEGMSDK